MKLILLFLPVLLLSVPSENETCYSKFTVPDIKNTNKVMDFIHVCIDGYSYIYKKDSITGSITLQQNWIIVNDQKSKSVPQTCDCEGMTIYDTKK